MTEKQQKFVDALLRSGDGEVALREAGYAPPWTLARVIALEPVRSALTRRCVADETEVAAFFSAVMRGAAAADERPPGVKDQLKAAELLGKHFGMFSPADSGDGDEVSTDFVGDELL